MRVPTRIKIVLQVVGFAFVYLGVYAAVYILVVAHIEAVKSQHTYYPNQHYSRPDIDFGALVPQKYSGDPFNRSWASGSGDD